MRLFRDNNQNKVVAILGLSLGGLGAAMTGGKNYAADMLNNIIDQDIQQQKFEAEKKGNLYNAAVKEKEILNNNFDRDEDRYAQARMLRLEAVKTKAEGMMASLGGDKAKAAMAATIGKIDENIAATKIQLFGQAKEETQNRPQVRTIEDQNRIDQRKTPVGIAYDQSSAEKVRAMHTQEQGADQLAKFGADTIKKYGLISTGEGAAKLQALQTQVVGALTTIMNSGTLQKDEYERYSKLVGAQNFSSMFNSKEYAVSFLNELANRTHQIAANTYRSNIQYPNESVYTPKSAVPLGSNVARK